jgi:RNA polymerase sigma-70 factor (ECF subfamily)
LAASDEDLIAMAVVMKDTAAFGELVQRYQGQVRGCLRQLTRDPAEADDLAQDTFIRAWDKLATYSGKGKFAAWLLKLAYNVFLGARRKAASRKRLGEALASEAQAGDAAVVMPQGEVAADLPVFMAALSEEERAVMVMGFVYGFSHAEISDATGMPVGTVKSHIHRARNRLRAEFSSQDGAQQEAVNE